MNHSWKVVLIRTQINEKDSSIILLLRYLTSPLFCYCPNDNDSVQGTYLSWKKKVTIDGKEYMLDLHDTNANELDKYNKPSLIDQVG